MSTTSPAGTAISPLCRKPWPAVAPLLVALSLVACAQPNGTRMNNGSYSAIGPNTLNVADAAIAGGDPNMALSVSQSILADDPNNVDALVHEGNAYYALNRCPAAMSSFQRALQADPHSALAEVGLGRCLLKTDPHAAEQAFMAAVQDDPANANAYNDLGIARDLQGNFAGAVGPYQQALRANPALTAAEVNLGLSLALSGHGPEALQYLGPLATSQTATPKIRQDYAAALVASGRADEARQVLAVDLPPDQVNQAMAGFSELIAASLQNQSPPPPPAPTVTQVQSPPVTAAPITPASPVAATPTAPPVAAAAPAPLLPAATPVAAAASPSPSPTIAMGGSAAVQLAALDSQAAAERQWRKSVAAEPALFNGKTPDISTATVHGKTYYRLRVTGFGNRLEAAKFCAELSAANMACTPANF